MTRRERLERKLERRREWAEKRRTVATATLNSQPELRRDWAFITQPGHIPERARMNARDDRAQESLKVAAHHESKAAGLEEQLDRSIFSDDEDAPERLTERIAELEAEREQMKRTNAAFRKGDAAFAAVLGCTIEQAAAKRARILDPANLSWHRVPFAAYELSNLGGNISRLKKRLEDVKARRERSAAAEEQGGLAIEECGSGYVRLTFADKPRRDILDDLKAAGFWWSRGSWAGKREALPDSVTVKLDAIAPGVFHADIRPKEVSS